MQNLQDLEVEIWVDVKGFEGFFLISNFGRAYSYERNGTKGGIMKGHYTDLNYHKVLLSKNGKKKHYFLHRLVGQHFIPNPYNLPFINHKDEDPSNNNHLNLEWCDAKYNTNYGDGIKRRSESRYKPIYQLDINGKIIKKWKSGSHICKEMKYSHGHISNILHGNGKTAYGFKWIYCHIYHENEINHE